MIGYRKNRKMLAKKWGQRPILKKSAKNILKKHKKYLKDNGWYTQVNFINKLPTRPSLPYWTHWNKD